MLQCLSHNLQSILLRCKGTHGIAASHCINPFWQSLLISLTHLLLCVYGCSDVILVSTLLACLFMVCLRNSVRFREGQWRECDVYSMCGGSNCEVVCVTVSVCVWSLFLLSPPYFPFVPPPSLPPSLTPPLLLTHSLISIPQMVINRQENQLEQVGASVHTLKKMGEAIGDELDDQHM